VWVDGVHFNVRLEGERACILVVIGATADGDKASGNTQKRPVGNG
jgi:transposase-like protein